MSGDFWLRSHLIPLQSLVLLHIWTASAGLFSLARALFTQTLKIWFFSSFMTQALIFSLLSKQGEETTGETDFQIPASMTVNEDKAHSGRRNALSGSPVFKTYSNPVYLQQIFRIELCFYLRPPPPLCLKDIEVCFTISLHVAANKFVLAPEAPKVIFWRLGPHFLRWLDNGTKLIWKSNVKQSQTDHNWISMDRLQALSS